MSEESAEVLRAAAVESARWAIARALYPTMIEGSDYDEVPIEEAFVRPRYAFLANRSLRAADAVIAYQARFAPFTTREACETGAIEAVRLLEHAEDINANCPECEGEGVPELCGECFPLFDAARVQRRLVMQSLDAISAKGGAPSITDAARLDFLESEARKSYTGISLDWVPSVEDESSGFRFMRRRHIGEPSRSVRAAIDAYITRTAATLAEGRE